LQVGDRVFTTNTETGSYAEYTLSKAMFTFRLDDSLSFEEGSALGIPYFTVSILSLYAYLKVLLTRLLR
jgi:NADPH2:quinone reductase